MSEAPQDTEHVELEESTEEKSVFVVDPDNYQKTKKLKSIHQARDHVLDVRKNKHENMDQYKQFRGVWYDSYHRHLAESVASYGHEVMPIIEEALENGAIDDELLKVSEDMDIQTFVYSEGRVPSEDDELEAPSPTKTMAVYRQLDSVLRELGLGLDFEEDKGPANI